MMAVVVKTTEVRPEPVPECLVDLTVGRLHDTQFSSMKCSSRCRLFRRREQVILSSGALSIAALADPAFLSFRAKHLLGLMSGFTSPQTGLKTFHDSPEG